MFGGSDSPSTPEIHQVGFEGLSNAEIRQKYKTCVDAKNVGLELDIRDELQGRQFV
jgi:hypothetical protein